MPQVKTVQIKSYDTSNNEDTDIEVHLEPATGTNNSQRVNITLINTDLGATVAASLNQAELQAALGVVS